MVLSGFLVAMDESRRQTEKFFGAAVFQKCCRGVGKQPTFAKQIVFENCSSCCNWMIPHKALHQNKKFFDPAIFQKCWRGVGEQPTFAKQTILQQVLPDAIAFLKLCNSNKVKQCESKLQIQTRQRGNCSTLVGKSRGGTPFCRMGKTVFS